MRPLLYYITDRSQFPGDESARHRTVLAKIAEAARAGVDYIQLREKDLSTRELEDLARDAVEAVRENSDTTRLLVNSRADVALAVGAEGVHLRSDDIPASTARSVWTAVPVRSSQLEARSPIIAVSCHSLEDVERAESEGADFAVFAPVFEKAGSAPTGLAALRAACNVKIPVLALGGVTLENAASCLEAGAAGIAGIRLFQEKKIEDVVRRLR
ncbi:MAG: thiamine phosphate synthase [Acidobacteria bacterium]|nr:thiamine phosphate synthase [Acidobacteriota bacterium]